MKKICEWCNKEFYIPKCREKTARFCSRSCLAKWKATLKRKEVICKFCNKKFVVPLSSLKIYCSKKCYYNARSNGDYKTKKICLQCGKEYKINSRIKTRKFCSRECSYNVTNFKEGVKPWNIGLTKETDKRLEKLSKKFKGKDVGFGKGYYHSEEAKKKIGLSKIELYKDPSMTPNWQGGISYEPYGLDFNKTLKKKVYKRDKYCCQLCGSCLNSPQVHHIDYNKNNNQLQNLIILCRKCHGRTNFQREIWQETFVNIIEENQLIKAGSVIYK